MPLSFYEIQDIAYGLTQRKLWLEASVAYQSLVKSARDELDSELAMFFAMNNQSVCLYFAGKYVEAIELQKGMHRLMDKVYDSMPGSPANSDLALYPEVKECECNYELMLNYVKNGGTKPYPTWYRDCSGC
jgi:hypothetical protein